MSEHNITITPAPVHSITIERPAPRVITIERGGGGSGSVTSVGMTVPTGLAVSGSPITSSGTFSVTYDTGYQSYTTAEASKLAGVATAATANSADATLQARANHTGSQLAATISDFSTAADARVSAAIGVSVQAYSANLTTWASITPSADVQSLVGAANYAAMRTLLDLEAGTDFLSPAGVTVLIREKLTADRTYYVRTDGSDSNTGLVDSSGGAFLTITAAYAAALAIDCAGFDVIIQVRDGTYTDGLNFATPLLGGLLTLVGNTSTPASCVISTTSSDAILNSSGAVLVINGLKLQTTTSGSAISSRSASTVNFHNIDFGSVATHHISAFEYGTVNAASNYAVSGGATRHFNASTGTISTANRTVTFTGTLAFTLFASSIRGAMLIAFSMTFSGGTITGKRFDVQSGAHISSGGGGASYFPGDSAGTGTNYSASPWGLYT